MVQPLPFTMSLDFAPLDPHQSQLDGFEVSFFGWISPLTVSSKKPSQPN
jgi:hypothetical protein